MDIEVLKEVIVKMAIEIYGSGKESGLSKQELEVLREFNERR